MSTSTRTTHVVQYEYDCRGQISNPANWQWVDDHRSDIPDEALAREALRKRRETAVPSKFTRAYRLVRRTITITDEVLAE